MRARKRAATVVLAALIVVGVSLTSVATSGAGTRRMTPLQVAQYAVTCASRNSGAKVTTYFDVRCAAARSSNISVSGGVITSPDVYPAYSTIGFLLDKTTKRYTCFAYPAKVGAKPVNDTNDCPLWILPSEYEKTNFPSVYAIGSSVLVSADSSPPTLSQAQSAAMTARGSPTVTAGSGEIFGNPITPDLTVRLSYTAGTGRNWCLWFYESSASGQTQTTYLLSPPGMYGTC